MIIDVLGADGQLGNELRCLSMQYLSHHFVFSDIKDVNICDYDSLKKHFETVSPDVVINCAAYTQVDKAESEAETAELVNHRAVELLADLSKEFAFFLFHISTDYVFDGCACQPYLESDTPSPLSVYGATKRRGEEAILQNAGRAVIIRTSWLYSSFGNNFVKTMLRLGQERPELRVVCDQIGSPTYAADLARVILQFLPHLQEIEEVMLFHFTNEGVCSWYDFARAIVSRLPQTCKVTPIESKDYPSAARRPFYSVLNKRKIKSFLSIEIPHWEDGLSRCLEILLKN
ncbi:MAG: dTDP-4-dehydrorhamnose reductase [Bacteroidales bacterium]|nr:dTDP-4-dehydrorhamnose reductase [Bacteroidales bacterium]